jgi:predicted nucleotidyltransferase
MNPITNEIIEEVTRRIAEELNPEEIILFGSYAWGTPHKYSDIDLCVIVPDGIPEFNRIEWGVRALNAINDLMVDVDVMVKTRSDVETFKTVRASLTRKIVEEGRQLYGQSKTSTSAAMASKSAT